MKKLIDKLWQFIVTCWNNDVLRYIFIGGCTTMVNLVSYYLLRTFTSLNLNVANTIAIILSILFAYVTNSTIVFRSKVNGIKERFAEFVKFISARATTMVIEVGGVWLMADVFKMNDYIAKFIIQFIVLVTNYILSKIFVFAKNEKEEA